MNTRAVHIVSIVAIIGVACGAQEGPPGDDSAWVGTVTTEGNVTTVVNESGSVWGGAATLVEELSIGVDAGPREYMFGEIAAVYADDAGIWVVDQQTPAVRLFDFDGAHVRDIGTRGEGPGEYIRPEQMATSADGRAFVVDGSTRRINIYSAEGDYIDQLPLGRGVMWSGYVPFVIDPAGRPWLVYHDDDLLDPAARRSPRFAIRAHGSNGPAKVPMTIPQGRMAVPGAGQFRPAWVWNITPTGNLLSGASDAYHFEISATNGTTVIVEKAWEPVPVEAEEANYFEYLATLGRSTARPATPMPDTKPAFLALLGAATGETWVLRQGRGFKWPDCNDRPASLEEMVAAGPPCWLDRLFFDVFGADGRFLGSVEALDEMIDQILRWARTPHFAGDRVDAVAIDGDGTIMVKRYRLVLPGEDSNESGR